MQCLQLMSVDGNHRNHLKVLKDVGKELTMHTILDLVAINIIHTVDMRSVIKINQHYGLFTPSEREKK